MSLWKSMTSDEKDAFITASLERHHRSEYDSARDLMDCRSSTPEWEDLSEEERERIREENRRYQQEMHDFGQKIRNLAVPTQD